MPENQAVIKQLNDDFMSLLNSLPPVPSTFIQAKIRRQEPTDNTIPMIPRLRGKGHPVPTQEVTTSLYTQDRCNECGLRVFHRFSCSFRTIAWLRIDEQTGEAVKES